ncbi:MAG: 30S ribosomal protein S9 [Patescibacteria group bacterium]
MARDTKSEKNITEKEVAKKDYVFAVGRRKESVARVRLYPKDSIVWGVEVKKGDIIVNKRSALEYFGSESEKVFREPLIVTNTEKKFAVTVKAQGGGNAGQLGATILGIARALDQSDKEKFHSILKKRGLLTRDARVRERRKVGMGGKSRRKKQSPKR